MSAVGNEFDALMGQVLAGSEQAAEELVQRYGPAVRRAVRRRLHPHLRPKFDSLDFVQDVWKSFFAHMPGGYDFRGPDELVVFLATLARNKLAQEVRKRMQGEKYNVNREQPLHRPDVAESEHLPADEPTPLEIVMGREELRRLLGRLPLLYQQVLALKSVGKSDIAIAAELGIHRRTVHRILRRLTPPPVP